jgi:hypothetical protein
MILSRIVQAGRDEHARRTMANHAAVIPRRLLKEGKLSYDIVDRAMEAFEKDGLGAVGKIPLLPVEQLDQPPDMDELKGILREDIVRNLINNYIKNRDVKIFLHYTKSDAVKRTKTAYLLSMLIDLNLELIPLAIFTDVPYGGAKRIFNLVISRVMIDVKPGGDWIMIPVTRKVKWTPQDKKRFTQELTRLLDEIYGK